MKTFIALLFAALALQAAEPIVVKWGGYKYRISKPDEVLWSQSQVAQSGVSTNGPFWDQVSSKGKVIHLCSQMRVRGVAGDRTSANYLVVCSKPHVSAEHGPGGLLRPKPAYFKRQDPWAGRARLKEPEGSALVPVALRRQGNARKEVTAEAVTEIRIDILPNEVEGKVFVITRNLAGTNVLSLTESSHTGFGCQYNPILEGTFQLYIEGVPKAWEAPKMAGDDWWIGAPPGKAILLGPKDSPVLLEEGTSFNNCFSPQSPLRSYSLRRLPVQKL